MGADGIFYEPFPNAVNDNPAPPCHNLCFFFIFKYTFISHAAPPPNAAAGGSSTISYGPFKNTGKNTVNNQSFKWWKNCGSCQYDDKVQPGKDSHLLKSKTRVPDQNGVSQAWYKVEIHHSGRKPSKSNHHFNSKTGLNPPPPPHPPPSPKKQNKTGKQVRHRY